MATSLGAPLPALFFFSVAQWLLPACELCRPPVPAVSCFAGRLPCCASSLLLTAGVSSCRGLEGSSTAFCGSEACQLPAPTPATLQRSPGEHCVVCIP